MEFRSSKIPSSLDHLSQIANNLVLEATSRKLELISGNTYSANGNGAASSLYLGIVAVPKGSKWRVVGIGGLVANDGHNQVAEICQWGYHTSDLGAADLDAFGKVTMDNDELDAWNAGEILWQGISPYEDFFGFDALGDAVDTWDIAGEGAGVLMGDWQTKAAAMIFTKADVVNSDALILPFMLVEYKTGSGVI